MADQEHIYLSFVICLEYPLVLCAVLDKFVLKGIYCLLLPHFGSHCGILLNFFVGQFTFDIYIYIYPLFRSLCAALHTYLSRYSTYIGR